MIKVTSKTFNVKDGSHSWNFISSDNGISIPGKCGHEKLLFQNSKISVVRSFYKAIGEFLNEVDPEQSEDYFPKYWVVNNDGQVESEFIKKLNQVFSADRKGEFKYYGYDGNSSQKKGLNGWDSLTFFENNPTLITQEQFFRHFGK